MRPGATLTQLVIHSSAFVALTALTGLAGAPILRVIHRIQGPWRYWITGTILTIAFWFSGADLLSIVVGSIWMTLGTYSEIEERGHGWKWAGFSALVAGTLGGIAGFRFLLQKMSITTWERFVDLVREKALVLTSVNPGMKFDASILAQQAPSAWVMFLILVLGTGLIFEDRLFGWLGLPREKVASHLKLIEFRLPDFLIWVALTGLSLTLVDLGSQALASVGANVLNVSVVLYFFQGLAVLEAFLGFLKVGIFMRLVTYLILVGQLFFILSVAGLIDYWVDFRRRLRANATSPDKDQKFGGSV